jgi:hypothetical protein
MRDMTRKRYRNRLIAHKELGMRDLAADWKRWSSAERLLAMVLMLMLVGLPLRVLIAGAPL